MGVGRESVRGHEGKSKLSQTGWRAESNTVLSAEVMAGVRKHTRPSGQGLLWLATVGSCWNPDPDGTRRGVIPAPRQGSVLSGGGQLAALLQWEANPQDSQFAGKEARQGAASPAASSLLLQSWASMSPCLRPSRHQGAHWQL